MIRDLRLAWRMFLRGRGASLVTVTMLAIAMAGTLTLHTVLTAMTSMWPELPGRGRLARIYSSNLKLGVERDPIPFASFTQWPSTMATLESVAAFAPDERAVADAPDAGVQAVTTGYFDTLLIAPVAGRLLTPADERDDLRVAVVGERLAQLKFGAVTAAIGTSIVLGSDAYTIVGVLPREFYFPSTSSQVWIPLQPAHRATGRGTVIGRLRQGRSWGEATAELAAVAAGERAPTGTDGWSFTPIPLDQDQALRSRNGLMGLLAPALAVLLIACVNATHLMLSRALERTGEFRIRLALGASARRLAQQLLIEGAVVATAGTLVGVLLSLWGIRLFRAVVAGFAASSADRIVFSNNTLIAAAGIAMVTPLLISLLPALAAARQRPASMLTEAMRTSRGPSRYGARDALVFAEVAVASVLVVMALMVFKLYAELNNVQTTIDASRVVVAAVGASANASDLNDNVERMRREPGIEVVATVTGPPLAMGRSTRVRVSSRAGDPGVPASIAEISSDYFRVLKLPILAGRAFDAADRRGRVAIVSANVAERLWGGLQLPTDPVTLRTSEGVSHLDVVGVVAEVLVPSGLDELNHGSVYLPQETDAGGPVSVLARTSGPATGFAGTTRWQARPLSEAMRIGPRDTALVQWLLAMFSAVALMLAAGGVFAVSRHAVLQRTREFGIRLSLGATPNGLVRMVISREMRLVTAGVVIAAGGTLAVTYFAFYELVRLATRDPFFWVGILVTMGGASLLACFAAARRISRFAPMDALRDLARFS